MPKFLAKNIERGGRIARGVLGVLLVAAGMLLHRFSILACVVFVFAGGFTLFEATRGWCLLRACGIKTRL